jgi:hypothetical protein
VSSAVLARVSGVELAKPEHSTELFKEIEQRRGAPVIVIFPLTTRMTSMV